MPRYPSKSDYIDIIVPNLARFACQTGIRNGVPRRTKTGGLFVKQGGMALTFPINVHGTVFAYRVWFTDLGDLRERYVAMDAAMRQGVFPWYVNSQYDENGVFFNNRYYPTMCMDWVEGETLEELLNKRWSDKAFIASLAAKFLDLVRSLHANRISHGDLQQGNIMFTTGTHEIKLIDYDSMWVPALDGLPNTTAGLSGYQHPLRAKFPYLCEKTDYFSELVIYLSLRAISENPRYWADVCNSGRMLFDVEDFQNPAASQIFATLKASPSFDIRRLAAALELFCRERDIEKLWPLEEVVEYLGVSITPMAEGTSAPQPPRKIDWGLKPTATQLPPPTGMNWGSGTVPHSSAPPSHTTHYPAAPVKSAEDDDQWGVVISIITIIVCLLILISLWLLSSWGFRL